MILSHTDKVVDRGYHRELLSSGAYVVYDQGIHPEETARLVRWMVSDVRGPAPARHRRRPAVAVVGAAAPRAWPPSAPTWSGWPTSSARPS